MKKIIVLAIAVWFSSCNQLQQVANQLPNILQNGTVLPQDIGNGLREALNKGVSNQVSKLTAVDGFYRNEAVKILLPEKLRVVDRTLRKLGMSALADEGLKAINRTAEEAVKTATPIFVDAVKQITFTDAKNILMGKDNAATTYLEEKTKKKLYHQFQPVIKKTFSKVKADEIWGNIIRRYNSIPFIDKVNPDLTDYVTNQALKGVFTMIAKEEKDIRKNPIMRTTTLLKKVFALQDHK